MILYAENIRKFDFAKVEAIKEKNFRKFPIKPKFFENILKKNKIS